MKKYTKTTEVQAMQVTGDNFNDVATMFGIKIVVMDKQCPEGNKYITSTQEDTYTTFNDGDWVTKNAEGVIECLTNEEFLDWILKEE